MELGLRVHFRRILAEISSPNRRRLKCKSRNRVYDYGSDYGILIFRRLFWKKLSALFLTALFLNKGKWITRLRFSWPVGEGRNDTCTKSSKPPFSMRYLMTSTLQSNSMHIIVIVIVIRYNYNINIRIHFRKCIERGWEREWGAGCQG